MKKLIFFLTIIFTIIANAQVKTILPVNNHLLEASLDSAIAQVGVCETTRNNDGGLIEQYLASVNLTEGNPYCAAGQYWCFYVSALALHIGIDNIPIKRTGLANNIMDDALRKGKKSEFRPLKHDLIVWRKGRTNFGHIERIYQVETGGWVKTIAFNTSSFNSNQRFTEGVFLKRRNVYHSLSRMAVRGLIGFDSI